MDQGTWSSRYMIHQVHDLFVSNSSHWWGIQFLWRWSCSGRSCHFLWEYMTGGTTVFGVGGTTENVGVQQICNAHRGSTNEVYHRKLFPRKLFPQKTVGNLCWNICGSASVGFTPDTVYVSTLSWHSVYGVLMIYHGSIDNLYRGSGVMFTIGEKTPYNRRKDTI